MDLQKEREAFESWLYECHGTKTYLEESFDAWQAAKAQANKQFENFIDQAIEDSACADERRSLQTLLEDFQELTT
jgi:hypothetical protein